MFWWRAARGRCTALGNDRAVGEPRGGCPSRWWLQRRRRDLPLSSPGDQPHPSTPLPHPPGPPRPAPSRSPSAHALSPRRATWRFKSRRLARVGRRRGGRARTRRPRVTAARLGQVGASPPSPGGGGPGAAEGAAPRGRAPRGGVLCAARDSRGRWRAPGAPPVLPLGPGGAGLSSAEGGLGWSAGSPAVPGRAAGGRGAGPPGGPRAGQTAGWTGHSLLLQLQRQSFLWKVAFIFFPCLGFTGKGRDESPRRAQSGTGEPGEGPAAGMPRGSSGSGAGVPGRE